MAFSYPICYVKCIFVPAFLAQGVSSAIYDLNLNAHIYVLMCILMCMSLFMQKIICAHLNSKT
jgi:hypothetical protein